MSKFDRGVFIFIGLGIWALAMTQIFKSEILQAGYTAKTDMIWFSSISGKCPKGVDTHTNMYNMRNEDQCNFLLTVNLDDLKKYPDYFY